MTISHSHEPTSQESFGTLSSGLFERPSIAGHKLFVAEYGHPDGKPVLLVHGTAIPFAPDQFRFGGDLNLRLIDVHQRGVGKSEPSGSIVENTMPLTIGDYEAIRESLGIARWDLYGWSLGSTASLLYTSMHPERVTGLTLSGVFCASEDEYKHVLASDCVANPDKWKSVAALVGVELDPKNLEEIADRLYESFVDHDRDVAENAMRTWLQLPRDIPLEPEQKNYLRVNFHYKAHRYFVDSSELLASVAEMRAIPLSIISGSNDTIVLPRAAGRVSDLHGDAKCYTVTDDHFFRSDETQSLLRKIHAARCGALE